MSKMGIIGIEDAYTQRPVSIAYASIKTEITIQIGMINQFLFLKNFKYINGIASTVMIIESTSVALARISWVISPPLFVIYKIE